MARQARSRRTRTLVVAAVVAFLANAVRLAAADRQQVLARQGTPPGDGG